jgi:gluconate kinase
VWDTQQIMIVHLNGWPGVGKRTIGEILAARMGARFIHNHLLHDVAIRCTGLSDPERWPLYEAVRAAVYDALRRPPIGETFVMTNGLCVNSPREKKAWRDVVDLAMARHVPLIPVVLHADVDELANRLQSQARVGHKLSDPDALREIVSSGRLAAASRA